MGLFDFVKDAGSKMFGDSDDDSKGGVKQRELDEVLADKQKGQTLTKLVTEMGLGGDDLRVKFRDGMATVTGTVALQENREKVVLLIGNTQGVARVDDRLKVQKAQPEATLYTVKSGDSLSKIAKAHYGDAMKYLTIFEANRPMLEDPNKIYPGQVLRIPPAAS
jgi:nucleoid-associated protein YgaU